MLVTQGVASKISFQVLVNRAIDASRKYSQLLRLRTSGMCDIYTKIYIFAKYKIKIPLNR